ncbi:MAG: DUF368 domain-containing protein, partial [Planctomycetota bacterium]|nr:DUF368 domain-containing protein [Planctomycetota bacterium]
LLHTLLTGVAMGAADVVPGVSGGTVALLCGVYSRLLRAISRFDRQLLRSLRRKNWGNAAAHVDVAFLMPLAAGLLLGLGLSVVTIKRMLENDTTRPATLACFFGMILASTWILLKQIRPANSSEKMITPVAILIGIATAAAVGMLPPADPQDQPPVYYLFGCGMLGICAMILPGISGAMILLLLGVYGYLLSLPEQLLSGIWRGPLTSLTIFAAGCAAGLASFSRALTYLMARHSVTTLSLLSGLMVGSLVRLWPFQKVIEENHQKSVTWHWPTGGWDVGSAATALLLGIGMVLVLQSFAVAKND